MNVAASSNISISEIDDPINSLFTKVIGALGKDGVITRGRLVKYDGHELWLQKLNGDIVMVTRSSIDRVWITHECGSVDRQ